MNQLEQLLTDAFHPKGTYINIQPEEIDRDKLFDWVTKNKIADPLDKSEYHVTVIYSQTPCPDAKNYDFNLPVTAKITGWDVFDSKISETGKCLVARLESKDISKMNSDIKEQYGATSTFPDFKPHITVSYEHKGEVPKEFPNMTITFNKVEVKALNPEWKP